MHNASESERSNGQRAPSGVAKAAGPESAIDDPSGLSEKYPMVMPGDPEKIAEDVARVGVEGKPADPKAGPGSTALLLGGVFLALVGISVVVWIKTDWATGLLTLGIVCLGILVSPAVWASLLRARDKKDILDEGSQRPENSRR